ncbi:related to Cell division control protein 4 [Zygosaccharomyces bailii]|nr:related to Cell division control protein 4 [Zygosaccharomyces bailii]
MRLLPASEHPLSEINVPFQYQIRDEERDVKSSIVTAPSKSLDAARGVITGGKSSRKRRFSGLQEEKDGRKRHRVSRIGDLFAGQKYAGNGAVVVTPSDTTAHDNPQTAGNDILGDPIPLLRSPGGREEEESEISEKEDETQPNMLLSAAQQVLGSVSGGTSVPPPSTDANGSEMSPVEETLPLSPLASPGLNTPCEQEIGLVKDSASLYQLYTDELFAMVKSELPAACYKNLLYQLVANLRRSDLSDLGTLIKDNLKRDFITSLPLEVALKILAYLPFSDIVQCLRTCKIWNELINTTPYLWKQMLISESFVSRDKFARYSQRLLTKYPHINKEDDGYQLDFLENCRDLRNWYNPNFIPQRTTLRGHLTSVVTCMQFEDDYVITGADDKIIRVYDAKKKQFLLELTGHDGGVWALKYDEDGILVSGSTDRTVRIWDINRGCCTHVFKGHTSTVRCLDIVEHRGVKYIVTGSRDHTLHVWKLAKEPPESDQMYPIVHNSTEENPYFVGVLRGHTDSVRTVSGHGNIVISGSYDNNVMVWDIAQMLCLYILSGHTDRIYSTIYDYKRDRCISASMDTTIRVWNLRNIWKNGTCTAVRNSLAPCTKVSGSMSTLQGHTALVGLLRLSDKFLVSGGADGSLRCWDSNDYSRKFAYHHSNMSAITTLYLSDNLLVSGSESQFNVYNLRSGALVHSNILRDADHIWSVNFKGPILVAAVERDRQSFVEILDFSKPAISTAPMTTPPSATATVSLDATSP